MTPSEINQAMSDTPRTDAQTFDIVTTRGDAHLGRDMYPCGSGDFVEANFARQLERELSEITAYAGRLEEAGDIIAHDSDDVDLRHIFDIFGLWQKAKETKP